MSGMGQPLQVDASTLNDLLAEGDAGDRFQRLMEDLLRIDHDLHGFATGGKDGGIDLVARANDARTVFECKFVGKPGYEAALVPWQDVEEHLRKHLKSPAGPTKGQSQYQPWYDAATPIRRYVFCVSCRIENEARRDQVRATIQKVFDDLAKLPHLAHLTGLTVDLIDANDVAARLDAAPHLLFRWFPRAIPEGFGALDADEPTSLRRFLRSDTLPYYAAEQHAQAHPPPAGAAVPELGALLARLDARTTGLVVTGPGGHGKTRMMLELGRLAKERGQVVLVVRRANPDALRVLAARLTPHTPTLLLIDYIEIAASYAAFIEALNDVADSRGVPLRYVASCRESYYANIQSHEYDRHHRVALSAHATPTLDAWWEGFRLETVRRILDHAGGGASVDALTVCGSTPVLAVFIAWLHRAGRERELRDLLGEHDFIAWVSRRVQQSFPNWNEPRRRDVVARVVMLLPLPAASVSALDDDAGAVLDALAADGWIERVGAELGLEDRWEVSHDVFADRIALSVLERHAATAQVFVERVLDCAAKVGTLASALIALQRLASQPALRSVNAERLIDDCIPRAPAAWRAERSLLMRFALLPIVARIALLQKHPTIWADAERDVDFQNEIGWFARWLAEPDNGPLPDTLRVVFEGWVARAAVEWTSSNYLLTSALVTHPDSVRSAAERWLDTRPRAFQTHYLLRAWLRAKLPTECVKATVLGWLDRFSTVPHASFVYQSWLDAGGDTGDVREALLAWLQQHSTDSEAQFVYQSWLDAGGDTDDVREALLAWLQRHSTDSKASFVYQPWLDAGGEKGDVREALLAWLQQHSTDSKARFVYRAWLDAGGEKGDVREALLAWLQQHSTDSKASFVYRAWLDAGGDTGDVREALLAWLQQHSTTGEARFAYRAWLDAGGDTDDVREALLAWLQQHSTTGDARFAYKAWLDADGDFESVARHVYAWLRVHAERHDAVFVLKYLARQSHLPDETVIDVLRWCALHAADEDALWRMSSLRFHLQREALGEGLLDAVKKVVTATCAEPRLAANRADMINAIMVNACQNPDVAQGPLAERFDHLLVGWLRDARSFGSTRWTTAVPQHLSIVARVVTLIRRRLVTLPADREPMGRFMAWVATWPPHKIDAARRLFGAADR